MQNYRENSLLFQEHLIVCSVDQESDISCHGLSPSHVLEHGTSGYVCILEENGSVSWNFSTAIRLISHSVGISHTLLPKPIRSVYEKLNVTFGTPLVDLIEYPSRGIMIFTSLVGGL